MSKIHGALALSWFWVTAPLWFPVGVALLALFFLMAIGGFAALVILIKDGRRG